jgi:hypothetical protein
MVLVVTRSNTNRCYTGWALTDEELLALSPEELCKVSYDINVKKECYLSLYGTVS